MQDKETKKETRLREMRKRRETMADARRYIIYYTFEKVEEIPPERTQNEEKENVWASLESVDGRMGGDRHASPRPDVFAAEGFLPALPD